MGGSFQSRYVCRCDEKRRLDCGSVVGLLGCLCPRTLGSIEVERYGLAYDPRGEGMSGRESQSISQSSSDDDLMASVENIYDEHCPALQTLNITITSVAGAKPIKSNSCPLHESSSLLIVAIISTIIRLSLNKVLRCSTDVEVLHESGRTIPLS